MELDMSPEAITNRLKIMEQLWELSVNLMQAREISETNTRAEKPLEKKRNTLREQTAQKIMTVTPTVK